MKIKASIPIDRLKAIAKKAGCTLTDKTTCVMVTKGSNKQNRLYIAKTRDVSRVNVNGFKIPDANLAAIPAGGPVGTFLQVVRFDLADNVVLANFQTICENLDTYKSEPKKPRGRPAGFRRSKNAPIAGPTVEVKAEETPKQHAERLVAELAKKRELAAKLGFPLSPKTIASFESKIAELREQA
jgi:hypothetical protein